MDNNDTPPYRKYRSKKANHKHKYEDVLFEYYNNWADRIHYAKGFKCPICGKLKLDKWPVLHDKKEHRYVLIQDIKGYYPNLPIVKVEGIYNNLKEIK